MNWLAVLPWIVLFVPTLLFFLFIGFITWIDWTDKKDEEYRLARRRLSGGLSDQRHWWLKK